MSTLLQDLRLAARLLVRQPGFSLVAVAILALGIGANSAMFGIVNTMLLRPRIGVQSGQLVSVHTRDTTRVDAYRAFSYAEYAALRTRGDVFTALAAHNLAIAGHGDGDVTRRILVDIVSSNFFETMGVAPALGRGFTADEERPGAEARVAVISDALWRRMGGTADVVGRSVRINARDFTVVGVAPAGFGGPVVLVTPDAFLPLGVFDSVSNDFMREGLSIALSDPRAYRLFLIGRLPIGATPASITPALASAGGGLAAIDPAGAGHQALVASPLSRISVSTTPRDDGVLVPVSALLLAMSVVVLCIASFNLANMLLVRTSARRREFAIRLAIGGSRLRIVRQLATEGALLAAIGGALGLLLSTLVTRWLVGRLIPVAPVTLSFQVSPDVRVVAATIGFAVLSTIVFSLGPALQLWRTRVATALVDDLRDAQGRRRLAGRNVLVMAQIALSLAMLTVAGLFLRGAASAAHADPGFTFDRGVLLQVDTSLAGHDETRSRAFYQQSLEALRARPDVRAAALASTMPFGDVSESWLVQRPGAPLRRGDPGAESALIQAELTFVSPAYFRALDLPILAGRDFIDAESRTRTPARPVIIDRPLADRLFGTENPVGQQLQRQINDETVRMEVVGLVPGIRQDLFQRTASPHVYAPLGEEHRAGLYVHVATNAPGLDTERALVPELRRVLLAIDPRAPILTAETRADFAARNAVLAIVRLGATIFAGLGLVSLLLASAGIYGVKAYVVSRRTREIGIRIALGAAPRDVVRLVVGEGLVLAAVGLAVGVALSLGAAIAARGLLYQADAIDPVTTLGAVLVLALAAVAASWIPARRAVRIQPTLAMRS